MSRISCLLLKDGCFPHFHSAGACAFPVMSQAQGQPGASRPPVDRQALARMLSIVAKGQRLQRKPVVQPKRQQQPFKRLLIRLVCIVSACVVVMIARRIWMATSHYDDLCCSRVETASSTFGVHESVASRLLRLVCECRDDSIVLIQDNMRLDPV